VNPAMMMCQNSLSLGLPAHFEVRHRPP
jgi:hypothetical protein